jgi:hypothetical protein
LKSVITILLKFIVRRTSSGRSTKACRQTRTRWCVLVVPLLLPCAFPPR